MNANSAVSGFRTPTALERAFNRFFGFLVGLGLGLKHNYLLQVRGRKSGKLYSTPIDLLEMDGRRFLVAPRGRTQWVRNAEAAGEITLKKGSFSPELSTAGDIRCRKAALAEGVSRQLQDHRAAILPGSRGFGCAGVREYCCELSGV